MKGKLYSLYVQCVMMYGSEIWAMKVEDMQRLERAEKMMIRWMCRVMLKDGKTSEELRERLGVVWVSIEGASEQVKVVRACGAERQR